MKTTLTSLLILLSVSAMWQSKKDTSTMKPFKSIVNTDALIYNAHPEFISYKISDALLRPNRLYFDEIYFSLQYFTKFNNQGVDSIKIYVHRSQITWINDSTAIVKPLKK